MYSVDSFDCARVNMGFTRAKINIDALIELTQQVLESPKLNKLDELQYLELLIANMHNLANKVIDIDLLKVLNLGSGTNPWEFAPNLKSLMRTLESPDTTHMVYEFQMNDNDKSRAIGNMLVYEYSDLDIIRVQPAQKNTVSFGPLSKSDFIKYCPVISNTKVGRERIKIVDAIFKNPTSLHSLNIQTFLKLYSTTYDANKRHSAALLEYWCSIFDKHDLLAKISRENYDDVGDSFIQILPLLKTQQFVR